MADARVLLAFAALIALALFYIERGLPAAFAPFCAAGSVMAAATVFACFGLAVAGMWAVYLACLAAAGWLVFRWGVQKRALPKLGFAFWFFVAVGLFFILLLWAKRPMFTEWDEFSLWGPAAKLLKVFGQLHTVAPIGWNWPQPSVPGMPVFAYFFQFFGTGFSEWQVYAAYDVFLVAAMAAVLAPFGRKGWNIAAPTALICLLTPYVFRHYRPSTAVSPVYLDSYVDIPLGFAFAAALAIWFASRPAGGAKPRLSEMLPFGLALAVLCLIKDIGTELALVAAVLAFTDTLFVKRADAPRLKNRAGGAFARLGIGLGVIVATFGGWSAYTGVVLEVDRSVDAGGRLNIPLQEIPAHFLSELFSSEKSEFFTTVTGGMAREFFSVRGRGSMLGGGIAVVAVIFGLLALAAFLTKDRQHRRRCLCFGLFSTLGFVAWQLLITMSYLYLFKIEQSLGLESYDRYIYPYYIGWLLAALLLLGQAVAGEEARETPVWWRAPLGKAVALGLAAAVALRVALLIPAQYTVFGVDKSAYNQRRAYAQDVEALTGLLDPAGRTFYVNSADNGLGWLTLCYQMLPYQLDYSVGGGTLERQLKNEDGTLGDKRQVNAAELEAYLFESGCDVVYLEQADGDFREQYGALFTDGMAAYFDGETDLYRVVRTGSTEDGDAVCYLEPMVGARAHY
ncbi:hypothetical protein LJC60_03595 [Ruminococcaceae bacterium OttesenSCG-928-D13]|nr:hypothetical protein [Ruminococcaceae bacterium OttesenSCG-928-D13]